jgi:hypothetical protein
MRHDPASGGVIIMLRSLKMYDMAQAVTDLIEQGTPAFDAAVPTLTQMLKAEVAEREVRSIACHMKSARFPTYKDLTGFDFSVSEMNEATVRQLHRCEFIDGAQNVALIGGPGTGKIHVVTAIGTQAVEHHPPLFRAVCPVLVDPDGGAVDHLDVTIVSLADRPSPSLRWCSEFTATPLNFASLRLVKLQKLSMPLTWTPVFENAFGRALLMRRRRSYPASTSPSYPRRPSETTVARTAILIRTSL